MEKINIKINIKKKINKRKFVAVTIGASLLFFLIQPFSYGANYKIEEGDTLYTIAKAHHISVEELKEANNLTKDEIVAGKYLYIPTKEEKVHRVQKGESLYKISQQYGVTPQSIKALNGLKSDTIQINQKLKIPNRTNNLTSRNSTYSATQEEIDLLARVVHGEARGESLEGQIAVAAVVLNRLHSDDFPDTIEGVIYEDLAFTAVSDGQINLTPNHESYQAVRMALKGYDPSEGSLYYWNPLTSTSEWIWSRDVLLKIDNHLFGI